MKAIAQLFVIVCASLWAGQAAADVAALSTDKAEGRLLVEHDYHLKAHVNYHTGLYRVFDHPVQTGRIEILQSGSSYCDIRVTRVEYTTEAGGFLKTAVVTESPGAVFEIPEGVVRAIDISFFQNYWTGVDCTVSARTADGGDVPTGTEELLGALDFQGGFQADVRLDLDGVESLKGFRLAVPAFCGDIDILEAGTTWAGTFYEANATESAGLFEVGLLGGFAPDAIVAAVNGPVGDACFIPVYGRF